MNAPSGSSAPRVLVVDDNESVRDFLTEVLTGWGPFESAPCEVETAASVHETLQLLSERPYNLVLLDMVLGDGNGLQVLEELQHHDSPPSVIIVSADDPPDLRKKCREMGAAAFLRKGDGVEVLVRETMAQLGTSPASVMQIEREVMEMDQRKEDSGPGRILIVDDDPLVCDALESTMKLFENVEVRSAPGGRAGLEIAKEWRPHVVLLDIAMPDMDGRQTLKEITEAGLKPRVIMISAFRDSEIAQECVDLGAVDYIPKPVDFPFLRRAVAGHLALAKREVVEGA
ncbi:MAG: response regulator [Candidatus Latescibacteria bacterium]|nr:response regulator [Candidatus Latescibacterota bacterium]